MYKTSVLLPLYNESETIEQTIVAVKEYAVKHSDFYFLFINDGSTDGTGNIVKERIKDIGNISMLELRANMGKASALKQAIKEVNSEYIVFNDGDMAYSMDHVDLVIDALKTSDIVIGNRKLGENSPRKVQRFVAGEIFNRLARLLLGLDFTDTQAGIKGFKGSVAKKLFGLSIITDFAFDAELLYIAKQKGYSVALIPAKVNKAHRYSPSTIKVIRDSPGMFFSLIRMIFYRISGRYNG
ncbi:MAG TPA: glycosyltransferase [Bacteroidia bacterium]|jgi:dolichyl-phosphate beta-glucosyltransferase|nr:glycosyltransferase [Bacteroidia bacterium]